MAQFEIASLGRAAQSAGLIQKLRDAQAARQNQGAMQNLARMAMGGDRRAKMELGARDPQMLSQLQGAINKMDTGQRERAKHAMEMQGRLANYVQSAPPPLRAQAYREGLNRLAQNDPEVAAKLPQEYQPGMEDRMFAMSVKASDMLTNAQRDIQAQGVPRSSEEFREKLKAKVGDDTAFEIKSADENAMSRMIAPEFEGSIDLDKGVIDFKTTEDATKARKVLTLATQLFRAGRGKLTRAEAVSQAFEDIEGEPPDPGGGAEGGNPFDRFDIQSGR